MQITFKAEFEYENTELTFRTDVFTLTQFEEAATMFLSGCGFEFDRIEILKKED